MGAGATGGSRRLLPAITIAGLLVAALIIVSPSRAASPANPPTGITAAGAALQTDTLTVNIHGHGSVSYDGVACTNSSPTNASTKTCTASVIDGTTVHFTATPGPGVNAPTISGDCSAMPCAITFTRDESVTATFVDTTPPAAASITAPADGSTVRSDDAPALSFSVSADTAGATCWVDGDSPAACSSPWPLPTSLTSGQHTAHVRAADVNDNTVDTARAFYYAAVPDTTDANFSGTPADGGATNSTTPAFSFPAVAQCTLDNTLLSGCANSLIASALQGEPDSAHTLIVAAGTTVNGVDYFDRTPLTRTWTIDTSAPVTTVSGGPPAVTTDRFATFAFTAPSLTPVSYACSLDGGTFTACASGVSYDDLALGGHTFAVRGTDAAGNQGAAQSKSWTVVPVPTPTPVATASPTPVPTPTVHLASRTVRAHLLYQYMSKGSSTWFTTLRLTGVTKGAKVTVKCTGGGCPKGKLTLSKLLKKKLHQGAVLEIRVSKSGLHGVLIELAVRKPGQTPLLRRKTL